MPIRSFFVPRDRRREALEVFYGNVDANERSQRVEETWELACSGELDLSGLALAERDGKPVGAALCVFQPDGTAFIWPPVVLPDERNAEPVADSLLSLLRERVDRTPHCWIAQALLEPGRPLDERRLTRNGFPYLLDLLFLQRLLDTPLLDEPLPDLHVETYDEHRNRHVFARVLERTYEGSLDCPELNGRRSGEQALQSHRTRNWKPELWKLYRHAGREVGVVLVAEHSDQRAWELVYLGVVPEARGRGYGRALVADVLRGAKRAGVESVFLSVDTRNTPARKVYERLGFIPVGRRRVFVRFGPRSRNRSPRADRTA